MTTDKITSEAELHHYRFFQDVAGNQLHLSVDSNSSEKVNMRFHATDAISMFAALCRIIPHMQNYFGEELGEEFVAKVANDPNLQNSLSVHVHSNPLWIVPKNLDRWFDPETNDDELMETLTEQNAGAIRHHLEVRYMRSNEPHVARRWKMVDTAVRHPVYFKDRC